MGGAGRLVQEEAPLCANSDDGKFSPQKQSEDERFLSKKETQDAFTGYGEPKDLAHDNASVGVPLISFLDLAERQALVEPAAKRMKYCTATHKAFDVGSMMKHVADIVLALAGLGLIRGGKDPTQEERRLQAEAYGHLGFLVQELVPKKLVPHNAIDSLMKDLGLCNPEGLEAKTFEQILEEFQPTASTHMVNSGHAGIGATTTERTMDGIGVTTTDRTMKDSDPNKYLRSASRFPEGGNGSSEQLQSELASQRRLDKETVPAEYKDVVAGSHAESIQAIQDLLRPRYPPDYTFQAAHSRAFMSMAMPCEMCKVVVRDTLNVLGCDTCEKVFHLQCLQSYLMTGIPKGDWHCPACSVDSKEKTEAPKYGRVKPGFSFAEVSGMPGKNFTKGPSNAHKTNHAGSSADGKTNMGIVANVTIPTLQKIDDQAPDSSTASQTVSEHKNLGGSFTALLDSFSPAEGHTSSKFENAGRADNHEPSSQPQVQTTTRSVLLRSQVGQPSTLVPLKPLSHALKGARAAAKVAQKDTQLKKTLDLHSATDSQPDSGMGGNPEKPLNSVDYSQSLDEPSVGCAEEIDGDKLVKETDRFGIEWVGDVLHVLDGKRFYSACTVSGHLYHLQDCALFRPETPKVPPYIARLQALWEDTSSGAKWVRVNWCYYPADMAMLPGRPSNPEVHEVYESNHGDNNLVGTIQGQCLVLQSESYAEEMERRQELLKGENTVEGLVPVFLCRWLYDVATATFRPTPGVLQST